MPGMSDDDPFYRPNLRALPARVGVPGELLFEFVRELDRAPMSCELRFHGESYGWEVQFFERGELFYSRGGFVSNIPTCHGRMTTATDPATRAHSVIVPTRASLRVSSA
jgi:hypothetical protein